MWHVTAVTVWLSDVKCVVDLEQQSAGEDLTTTLSVTTGTTASHTGDKMSVFVLSHQVCQINFCSNTEIHDALFLKCILHHVFWRFLSLSLCVQWDRWSSPADPWCVCGRQWCLHLCCHKCCRFCYFLCQPQSLRWGPLNIFFYIKKNKQFFYRRHSFKMSNSNT